MDTIHRYRYGYGYRYLYLFPYPYLYPHPQFWVNYVARNPPNSKVETRLWALIHRRWDRWAAVRKEWGDNQNKYRKNDINI